MRKEPLTIAVGGPIGVGKTTFCSKVKDRYNVEIIREIPEDKNHLIHKFLEQMYGDMFKTTNEKDYSAFAFQTYLLGYRTNKLIEHTNKRRVFDRTILEDKFFAMKLITDSSLREIYCQMWDRAVRTLLEKEALPDLYLILEDDWEVCLSRIQNRGRECEVKDFEKNKEYYKQGAEEYTQYLKTECEKFNIPYRVLYGSSCSTLSGNIREWDKAK